MARLIEKASLIALALAFAAGCNKPAEEPAAEPAAPAPAAAEASPTPAKPAAPAEAAPAAKNYVVRITPGDATAGQPASSVIEITPAAGYKMNLEFPSRLALDTPEGAALGKTELTADDLEITEKALKFTVAYTPEQAGQLDLAGAADFSVCNENACKLVRDEKVAWQVAVK